MKPGAFATGKHNSEYTQSHKVMTIVTSVARWPMSVSGSNPALPRLRGTSPRNVPPRGANVPGEFPGLHADYLNTPVWPNE